MTSQLTMGFYRPEQDICANRHRTNVHSQQAHEKVKKYKGGIAERLRLYVYGCDFHGATLKELCAAFHKLPNEISGRLSELRRDGRIFDSRREREGCAVYVTDKSHCALWAMPEVQP